MAKSNSLLLALTAFSLGCAATAVVANVVPPARAQSANPAWEYFCMNDVSRPWKPNDLAKLNSAGAAGWELVNQLSGSNYDVFCFKRHAP